MKKSVSLFLCIAFYLALLPVCAYAVDTEVKGEVWDGSIAECFSFGTGTVDDPFLICTASELPLVSSANYFKLINDIDLNNIAWTPIDSFSGNFDGGNHIIKNLNITIPKSSSIYASVTAGIFSNIAENGCVKDLFVEGSISANSTPTQTSTTVIVGGIAGQNAGTIANVTFSGDVSGKVSSTSVYVGGLVGKNTGEILFSKFDGAASATASSTSSAGGAIFYSYGYGGGIVGENRGNIVGCAVKPNSVVTVTTSSSQSHSQGYSMGYGGGLVGYNTGSVSCCSASTETTTNVGSYVSSASSYSGGLLGYNSGDIMCCKSDGVVYSCASVAFSKNVTSSWAHSTGGGFCGKNKGTISNSYSENTTSNSALTYSSDAVVYSAGFVSDNSGIISSCYSVGSPYATASIEHKSVSNFTLKHLDGFCYNNGGTIEDCYFLGESCSVDSLCAIEIAQADICEKSTYPNWDLVNIWNVELCTPSLWWEGKSVLNNCAYYWYDKSQFVVEFLNTQYDNADHIIVAEYSAKGQLLNLSKYPFASYTTFPLAVQSKTNCIKLFLLNENYLPATSSITLLSALRF